MNEITTRAELERIDREISRLREEAARLVAECPRPVHISTHVRDAGLVSINDVITGCREHDRRLLAEALMLFHRWQGAPYFDTIEKWREWAREMWEDVVRWRRYVIEPDESCRMCEGAGWAPGVREPTECQACKGTGVQK
jgi:hypothetical protein